MEKYIVHPGLLVNFHQFCLQYRVWFNANAQRSLNNLAQKLQDDINTGQVSRERLTDLLNAFLKFRKKYRRQLPWKGREWLDKTKRSWEESLNPDLRP